MSRFALGVALFMVAFSAAMLVRNAFDGQWLWVLLWAILAVVNTRNVIALLDAIYETKQ